MHRKQNSDPLCIRSVPLFNVLLPELPLSRYPLPDGAFPVFAYFIYPLLPMCLFYCPGIWCLDASFCLRFCGFYLLLGLSGDSPCFTAGITRKLHTCFINRVETLLLNML